MNINIKNGNSLELLKEETGEELKEKFIEQYQEPRHVEISMINATPLSSRVRINATPSEKPITHYMGFIFFAIINATPRENKCNTINATPVRLCR